jgi:hypothetical protein
MATVNIRIGLDNADIKRGAQEAAQELKSALNGVLPVAQRVGSAFASVGQQLTLAVTLPLSGLGAAAIKAASDLDKSRAQLTALTGSAENANKKLAELREIARTTPGVTTQFATTLFVQFKALGTVTEESIEKITKSLGRLNAVFTLADPQTFARNLEQIFSGGFERDQIKEALNQVPIFEQLIEQAFKTKDANELRKLKESGKLTMQTWISGLQNAIDTDPRFSNVQQTIAAKFAALQGEVSLALAPLGEALLRNLLPIIERIVPKLVELADAFGRLDPGTQESIVKFGLLFAAIGPVITAFGSLALGISSVLGLLTGSGAAGGVGLIGGLTTASTLLRGAAFGVAGLGLAFLALESDIDGPLGKLQSLLRLLPSNALRPGGRSSLFTPTPGLPAGPQGLIPEGPSRDRIRSDLYGVIPGVTGTRRGGSGTGDAAIQAAKQRNEQLERLELDRIRQSNRLLRADGEERQRILTEQFDKGLVTMRQYYDDRLAIQIQGIQAELKEIEEERRQVENRLSGTGLWQGMAATGTERLQIEGKLLEILTNQLLKVRELTTALRENFEEYKKRNALPQFDLDRARVEAVDPRLSPENALIERAREAEAARTEQVNALNLAGVNIRREILAVENQMELGQITAVQARERINALLRQERDAQIAILEIRKQSADLSELDRANIDLQIEQLRGVGVELTNMQRFAQGFNSEVESFGDAFARFGQNVSRAFGTFTGLFDNLKRSIRQFFSDLIGSGIQQTLGMIFSALSGGRNNGGGGMGGQGGGGGTGGFLGNLLGGLLGGRGGGGGGRFTTPPFAGGSIPGVTGVMVGSLPVMPNIGGLGLPGGFPGLGGGIGAPGGFQTPGIAGGTLSSAAGGAAGSAGLAAALKGFGFGLKPGSAAGPLAAIAPLLGAGLGMQLGGQSRSGQILGAIGGLAFGAGVTAAPAFLAKTFLAKVFSNPITAVVGAALLIGSLLLGRSQQRRRDEEQSGIWLQAAIDQIMALKDLARKGQVDVTQARSIFDSQILQPFISNINTLKTKSVRESRLTNQVRDLRNLFESQVIPAVVSGQRRNVVSSKLIPEFAAGGLVVGSDRGFDSVLARVRPGEMVLTREQQQSIQRAAGYNVFAHAGVPNVAAGGFGTPTTDMSRLTGSAEPMSIDLSVNVGVTRQDAAEILAAAGTTSTGQRVIVSNVRRAQRSRKV